MSVWGNPEIVKVDANTKPMLRYRTIGVELNMRRSTEDFERKEDMHSMWKRV